ncbi:AAA family ATPase [Neogemmobacter tilapiae]|uniref:AAA family ATPase n=1 Tax=Neogemmobacter tilapiae TaxID=875041 RepID=A0A918TNQ3_9RHOB|nr:AAA family ATPase [Gemmobacter tilapiae]GHC54386.1 hypothetical protein GCM10007315_16610 [Gemmobacter tilapiae]
MFDQIALYLTQATASDFFAGGLVLGCLGLFLRSAQLGLLAAQRLLARRCIARLTVDNRSHAYRQIYAWLENSRVLAHVRQVRVTDLRDGRGPRFGPEPGTHWFRLGGVICRFERAISDRRQVGQGQSSRMEETLTLSILGGGLATIHQWLDQGAHLLANAEAKGPEVYVLDDGYWESLGHVSGRPLASVITEDDRLDLLASDLRHFLASEDWYLQRGVPWRRGYLLYGPPGTGKSSAIRALASELRLAVASIDLGRPGLTDDGLVRAFNQAPQRALITLEDVDALFRQREVGAKAAGISFSGLLNAIDGVGAQEGRALIMTTNHIERLDPALIRPGRADLHVELGRVGAVAAGRLFARFFPNDPQMAESFVRRLGAARFTPAELQGWLLANAHDPAQAAQAEGLLQRALLAAA